MHTISLGDWELWIEDGSLPELYEAYLKNASFVDQIDLNNPEGRFCFLGISNCDTVGNWPSVVISQRYRNAECFNPGFLVVPETSILFIGAGERLLCYDIEKQKKLWEERTDFGFWRWGQSGEYVLMSAELEFGVWGQTGEKLWSTFVEPPWTFKVSGQVVELDIMGTVSFFRLSDGKRLV